LSYQKNIYEFPAKLIGGNDRKDKVNITAVGTAGKIINNKG